MTDYNLLAVALLTCRDSGSEYSPISFTSFHKLLSNMISCGVSDPFRLFELSFADIKTLCGSDESTSRVCGLLSCRDAMSARLDSLQQKGIHFIGMDNDRYPLQLLKKIPQYTPPLFFCMGNSALINTQSVAAVGSREPSRSGADFARALGNAAAEKGITLVSGGANGCDKIAQNAASDAGGSAVLFLAKPLYASGNAPQARRLMEQGRLCLLSDYDPLGSFQSYSAMYRNRYIYASAPTVVCESRKGTGGSYRGALHCLQEGYGSVYAYNNPDCVGNTSLISLGARALSSLPEDLMSL